MGRKLLYSLGLVLWAGILLAVGMHYPGDNFNCATECHTIHGATISPLLNNGNTVEEFCLGCHNSLGPGTAVSVHQSDPASGNGFNFQVTCTVCHDPHRRPTLPNIKNIHKSIEFPAKFTGKRTVQFTSRYEYVLGNGTGGPWGICEVCHTQTAHHTYDGAEFTKPYLDQHYTRAWAPQGSLPACGACHMHNNYFWKPSGDQHCVDCHSVAQGTRKAIVPEFGRTGAHFALATDADPTRQKIKQDRQCLVCHDVTEHQKGKVRLRNPDDDTQVLSFTKFTSTADLPRNGTPPAGEITQDELMNNFCFRCHDSDASRGTGLGGASDPDIYNVTSTSATALTPFGTGSVVDVYGQFAPTHNSYHPVRAYIGNPYCNADTLTATYWNLKSTNQTLNCWDCHEVTGHGGVYSDMTVTDTRSDNVPAYPPNSNTYGDLQRAFCTRCHDSGVYVSSRSLSSLSHFRRHESREDEHGVGNPRDDYGCRSCHAGLVNNSYLADNGSGKGRIHGYSFTFPERLSRRDGMAPVSTSKHFLVGGYLSKWIEYWPSGSTGTCWGGVCDHDRSGGGDSKSY